MANKENVQKLIDQISYSEKYKGPRYGMGPTGFDMDSWFACPSYKPLNPRECNTTACLAGHISLMQNGLAKTKKIVEDGMYVRGNKSQIFKEGCEFLGISKYQGEKLFLMDHTPYLLWQANADDAIKALEGLRDTGKVSWKHLDA